MKDFIYEIEGNDYPVHITHKRMKNVHYRFKDGAFYVSCHPLTTKLFVMKGLDKFGAGLIKRNAKEEAFTDSYIYLYGVKVNISYPGKMSFIDGTILTYSSKEELWKKLKKMYKSFIEDRVAYYSSLMNVPLYKVQIREMSTRFGSNSKMTKSVHFSTQLMHFSSEIIDSVIVHELAHILVFNHSKAFYDVVYKYCPNYKIYRKKLLKGEYQ